MKEAYSEQRCIGKLAAKELGSNKRSLEAASLAVQREKPVLKKQSK